MLTTSKIVTVPYDEADISRRSRDLAVLLEISNLLAWSQTLTDVLYNGLSTVLKHFEFDAGRIYLMEESGHYLRLAASLGVNTTGLKKVALSEGFSGKAATSRQFIAQHVSELPDKARVALLTKKGLKVVICVPLIALDRVVGVLNLGVRKVVGLDAAKVDLLLLVGNQIAVAVNNARLQEDLREKARLLEEQKRAIQFFAYTASHDLKSPAVGIHGLTQRLLKGFAQALGEKGRQTCEQILSAAARIEALVREVNIFIGAREAPLRLTTVDMAQITAAVLADFDERMAERGIRWEQPPRLPTVRGEVLSLSRALQNLVDNALKYGGPKLSRLRLLHQEDETSHTFGLLDDGVGLSAQAQKKIFQAFQRGETSQGTEGTGLGLAIVAEVAARHGGRAWVESSPGQGATFFFSLAKDPEAA